MTMEASQISFAPPTTVPRLSAPPEAFVSSSSISDKVAAARANTVSTSIEDFRDAFKHTITVLGLRINASDVTRLRKGVMTKEGVILNAARVSNVVKDPSDDKSKRLLLLNVSSEQDLSAETASFIKTEGFETIPHQIDLNYDWYTTDEVLSAILPQVDSKGTPTAYSTIGHIAHLNLREEYLPFRYIIGQVILQKNPNIRTVVNKLDSIDTVYRFFDMELLAGEPDYIATVSESNVLMTFDFRKVYFNSRLHTEHGRIIALMQPGEVVSDVMAGVGPFALPAAKKGCIVYANDLNPSSYESLSSNAKMNKVESGCKSYCEDGRYFIKESVKRVWNREITGWQGVKSSKQRAKESRAAKQQQQQSGDAHQTTSQPDKPPLPPSRLVDHFVMNLPDSALEFLDAYRGAYKDLANEVGIDILESEISSKQYPMVHVHCFTKDLANPHLDVCNRANHYLGLDADHPDRLNPTSTPEINLHWVRRVSPNKDMYCLSFRLPKSVLFDQS
ncbi:unnamed protein product [Sympodiomycopsis kandeliae]